MRVESWDVRSIRPYPFNPRKNDDAVEAVAASIREYGFRQPIVVDADGTVVVGHTRLKAAKRLGLDRVPVVVASDLTPEQVNAYRLADNKTAEIATWDEDMLREELLSLDTFDAEEFGFELAEDREEECAPQGDGGGYVSITLTMPHEMFPYIDTAMSSVGPSRFTDATKQASKVMEVVAEWAER